jgi:uncharacterized protein (TIGR03435 family)
VTRLAFFVCVLVPITMGQVPSAKFEVASVRKLDAPGPGAPRPAACAPSTSPGRLTMCTNILSFVSNAYGYYENGRPNLSTIPALVEGGPDWIRTDLYAINAKAPDAASQEMMRGPMMQALLEDRFKLKLHREVRQVSVYELTVKNEAKLRQHQQGACTPFERGQPRPEPVPGQPRVCEGISISNGRPAASVSGDFSPLDTLATGLYGIGAVDRPIVNKTGFTRIYDVHLQFVSLLSPPGALAQPGVDDASLPSVFTALEEELGLKLAPAKGPQEFLIIDSIERPSED